MVRTSAKVDLTKEQKAAIGLPSMPRPEIDLVAYRAATNELLALECKSYLDSRGVTYRELSGAVDCKTYKLFRRPAMRDIVLKALRSQFVACGLCPPDATVRLGLIAGKVSASDEGAIQALFKERGWLFHGPAWLKDKLGKLAGASYENQVSAVVTKLLLR